MSIPESQLQTWSNCGAQQSATLTYSSIQRALPRDVWAAKGKDVEVYLQGSYRNDTNIRGDSDVDVVVQLNSTFQYDLSQLPESQAQLFKSAYADSGYGWTDFRNDILSALQEYYGSANVKPGNKAIKVLGANGRLPADVVVCLQFRKYKSFQRAYNTNYENYVEGIRFWAMDDRRWIINYPKPHYDNGVAKNKRTAERYKPSVRMFKNVRSYLADNRKISPNLASSYFLQCLLYNAPDAAFRGTGQQVFCAVLNWLAQTSLESCVCQNGEVPLFGYTPEQWSTADAQQFIRALVDLWNSWR